jgi:hypothetical protein
LAECGHTFGSPFTISRTAPAVIAPVVTKRSTIGAPDANNAVNADRIRSGLLTEEMITSRSKARGLSEDGYMRGNLLGREVAAEDVAQAFLAQALALKTTADVTTVDGGNIAAALR